MHSPKKQKIFDTLVNHVATKGIYDVSTKGLAEEAHLAEGLIFYYFKTKQNLFDECAAIYDRGLMDRCTLLASQGKDLSEVWDILFDELLKDPNGAIFYFDYVNYFGFNPTEKNKRAHEYLKAAKVILASKKDMDDHNLLILWDYVTTQLFYYVNKIAKHELENTKETKAFIKKIAFVGYEGA